MLRRALLAASASTRSVELITTTPVTRDVVARFVAGDTADDAIGVTQRLLADGLLVTIDYLGEDTADPEQATAVADEYIAAAGGGWAGAGLAAGGRAEVSVKPTAVGLGLRRARREDRAGEHRPDRAPRPANAGTTVTLDMEDHTRIDADAADLAELRADFPDLGCVIQSYLRRSADDCRALATAGSRVRLCKGAYRAPDGVACRPGADVDRSLRPLPADPAGRPGLPDAGHPRPAADPDRRGQGGHGRAGRPAASSTRCCTASGPPSSCGWPATARRSGSTCPYGSDWYGYLVRRLAERPANLAFFLRCARLAAADRAAAALLPPAVRAPPVPAAARRDRLGRVIAVLGAGKMGEALTLRAAAGGRARAGRRHRRRAPRASAPPQLRDAYGIEVLSARPRRRAGARRWSSP